MEFHWFKSILFIHFHRFGKYPYFFVKFIYFMLVVFFSFWACSYSLNHVTKTNGKIIYAGGEHDFMCICISFNFDCIFCVSCSFNFATSSEHLWLKSFIILLHERFLAGFFFAAVPWYVGAFILLFVGVDYREKAGLLACTIGASIDSSCVTYLINLSLC